MMMIQEKPPLAVLAQFKIAVLLRAFSSTHNKETTAPTKQDSS